MQRLLREQPKERANCLSSSLYLLGMKGELDCVSPHDFPSFRANWKEIGQNELQQGDLIVRFDGKNGAMDHIGIVTQTSPVSVFHKLNWFPYALDSVDIFRDSIIVKKESYLERYFRTS